MEYIESGSADCPLIRLYEFNRVEAGLLHDVVTRLATGSIEALRLHDQSFIEAVGGCRLTLRVGKRDSGIVSLDPRNFECVLTTEAWHDVAFLVEPFYESDVARFQWLNERSEISLLLTRDGRW